MASISVNDKNINLKEQISTKEVFDLIHGCVEDSMLKGFVDPYSLKILLNARFILMVTDLELTEEQKEDIFLFYDYIINSGILKTVVNSMSTAYDEIMGDALELKKAYDNFTFSIAGGIQKLVVDNEKMQESLSNAKNKLEEFDPAKLKNLIEFKESIDGSKTQ